MMDNHPPKTAPPDENTGPATNRKPSTAQRPASDQTLKCPRCDSPNTKFCYYNNYSLTQPRHFCKTCRRYWTKGGALRNVPIGGGCRKSKKSKSSSSSNSSCKDAVAMSSDSILGPAGVGGMKFFPNLSPAMEFHLSGLPFSRLHSSAPPNGFSNFFSFGDLSSAAPLSTNSPSSAFEPVGTSSTSLMGFNYPISSVLRNGEGGIFSTGIQEMGCSSSSSSSTSSINLHSNLASSIESLSSINQDLHWKLQQQRLAMLFGGENQKDGGVSAVQAPLLENHQIPISLQMQESLKIDAGGSNSKRGCGGENASEWFFGSSYGAGNGNSNGNNTSNWSEIQAWNDLQQYSALP